MSLLVGAAANSATGSYNIDNSLRLRQSVSASLNRTASSAPTNGKKVTVSLWIKRSEFATRTYMLQSGSGTGNDNYSSFYFNADNTIQVGMYSVVPRVTTQVFRDPSAWYHMVLAYDTTQASADNRVKLYINGEQVTSFTTNGTIPSDTLIAFTKQSQAVYIGTASDEATYLDAYIAEYHVIDGQQLAPTDFGETDEDTGVWKPKKYTGTYGTNGFYLKFGDTSSVAALGTDSSGNGNTWTVNNVSLTAGATYDSMSDVPTLTDEDTSNFATLNPLGTNNNSTITDGNLTVVSGSGASTTGMTIGMTTGKWYAEYVCTAKSSANMHVALVEASTFDGDNQADEGTNNGYMYQNDGKIHHGFASESYGASWAVGDVIGIAFDASTRNVEFFKNGTGQGTYTRIASENSAGTTWIMTCGEGQGGATATFVANFGQRPFAYTPPTGYKKINTFNLPDSTIVDGRKHFDTRLRTGTGSEVTVSDLEFQPDLLWTKTRSNAVNHNLHSSLMSQNYSFLQPNTTNAENNSASNYYMTPTSTGYIVGSGDNINQNTYTFVDWLWKAGGGTGVSNTLGAITTSVSANTTAGFSIATWTKNGGSGARTIGHGLGGVPELVFFKEVDDPSNWSTYVGVLGNTSQQYWYLDLSVALPSPDSNQWANTAPTSTLFTYNQTYSFGSNSSAKMIGYFFRSIEGYSKISSYIGNGSTDGTFIYTGFRPALVIVKSTDSYSWMLSDSARDPFNLSTKTLFANSTSAEQDSTIYGAFDILSNGFKWRTSDSSENSSGVTYFYMAFAENPFKNSLAR